MPDNNTRDTRDTSSVVPIYRPGDEITFKYEGNVRATVEGSEVIGGKTWLVARASLEFKVPASQVLRAERGEPGR
jgi:hypothetical protein